MKVGEKMGLYEIIKDEISLENIYKDMTYLVDQVGERLSGTEEMRKATEYICQRLNENGVEGHIDHFPMYQSYPGEAELKVMGPEVKEIKARPVCHIDSTPEEGIERELVYLGSGTYEDYEGVDVKGKIVLTDMNWSPGRPEKARIAWEMGAAALIIMNWGKPEDDLIQMGAVKAQWGNPTPNDVKDIVRLTVISISRGDGEYLASLCEKGPVKVWLKADSERKWITADQPIGRLRGGKSKGRYVLVGSHVDAWGKSAICNASGNALNLELARIFAEHKDELENDIVFTFWDGHEVAEGGGSTWYCDNYWPDMTENCIAYVNIDNLAIRGTTIPGVEGQPEQKNMLMDAIKTIWGVDGQWHHAYKGGGDSSFFGIGVPYIAFATEYTEEMLEELNYAFYSPWLHTPDDTVDKIDRDLMQKHVEYFMYVVEKLVNSKAVPYNLSDLADDVALQWTEIKDAAGRAGTMVDAVSEAVEAYVGAMKELYAMKPDESDEDAMEFYNKIAMMCERQTTPFRCYSGRYGQDSCCALATENPMPALKIALDRYNSFEDFSDEANLWETEVLRRRNQVYDALINSVNFLNLYKAVLK